MWSECVYLRLFARTLGVLDLCAEGHYCCDFFLVINIDEKRIEKNKVHKQFEMSLQLWKINHDYSPVTKSVRRGGGSWKGSD